MLQQINCIYVAFICLFHAGGCQLPPETTEKYWLPDENGVPQLINLNETEKDSSEPDLKCDVTFQLYTGSNPLVFIPLMLSDHASVGYFNSSIPTNFVIHGWISSTEVIEPIRKAFIERGGYNVIVVDWTKLAGTNYFRAKNYAKQVGVYLGSFIDFMVMRHNLRLEDVHIVGHSLGAQVAGIAASNIKTGKLGRITGLDPAMPLFADAPLEDRLDSGDAQFVEVIHTDGGIMGWKAPLGLVDFYPNKGGLLQPGCKWKLEALSCSHRRAVEFFAESITTRIGFVGFKCPSWKLYKDGDCFQNPTALMGEFTNTSSRGMYYLKTAATFPFALGEPKKLLL